MAWKRIVLQYGVIGTSVHDARIVAAMLASNIGHVVTLNARDFSRYAGITAVEPADIISAQTP